MKKEPSDDLIRKYLAGETSLDEEEVLISTEGKSPDAYTWFTYASRTRRKARPGLNDSIRTVIQNRKKRNQRFLFTVYGIAASIAIFLLVSNYQPSDTNAEYKKKEALLNEALSLFPEEKTVPASRNIVYEDEMVIIYLTSK